jgi:RNA polymerase sigma-70 factor (ECF subfamily)
MFVQREVDWKATLQRIQDGDPLEEEVLYRNLASGMRFLLRRRLQPDEVEDRLHDVYLIVLKAIRRGDIREPEHLMAFARTVLNRQVSIEIGRVIRRRTDSLDVESAAELKTEDASPEEQAVEHQKVEIMKQVLREMNERDFDVLARFYLSEQSRDQICKEMRLTETQFNLLKARAKGRLMKSVRRKLTRPFFNRE